MMTTLKRWFTSFRFWIIRVVAGSDPIMIGYYVNVPVDARGFISNCRFETDYEAPRPIVRALASDEYPSR